MSTEPVYSQLGRMPQRVRGRERRDAIIDAACAILAENGEEALTLRAVAHRADTSIGSMYHFFSDREQLLHAVADRHREALEKITAPMWAIPSALWTSMNAADVIQALFHAPLAYYLANPDALVVHHRQDSGNTLDFQRLLLKIMRERLGASVGSGVAATLYAVSTGTLFFMREMQSTAMATDAISLEQVLIAFLEKAEDQPASAA